MCYFILHETCSPGCNDNNKKSLRQRLKNIITNYRTTKTNCYTTTTEATTTKYQGTTEKDEKSHKKLHNWEAFRGYSVDKTKNTVAFKMKWENAPESENSYTCSVSNPADVFSYGIEVGAAIVINSEIEQGKEQAVAILARHKSNIEEKNDCINFNF